MPSTEPDWTAYWRLMEVWAAAILDELRAEGYEVRDEDVKHLLVARHEHINPHGKYHINHEREQDDRACAPCAVLLPLIPLLPISHQSRHSAMEGASGMDIHYPAQFRTLVSCSDEVGCPCGFTEESSTDL